MNCNCGFSYVSRKLFVGGISWETSEGMRSCLYYVFIFIEFVMNLVVCLVHCLEGLNSLFMDLECYYGFCWIMEKINSNYEMIFYN